jgi:DNA-binding NarL/FixJ family response regulator/anti-sigma regulatory factor (Ser/Thr protein kinase)
MFKELAYRKGIKIKNNIQDYIYTKIDKNSMDRIINNLIDNAIKYTHSNGEINITLKADNKDIELIISDTGIGISKEEQKNIFKPYYQISHNKSNTQGIGMGLNIVKKIITEINGKIQVESEKDRGTTFRIKLKRYYLKEKDKVEFINKNKKYHFDIMDIKLRELDYKKDKHNLFVVEDNIQMLSYLQESLYDKYNFYYAVNGKNALEKFKNIPLPDIIISDIMMDEMDGYEFYEELLKLDDYKSIPFIFLTAKSGKQQRHKGLQKGAIDYIEKPFDMPELQIKINSILKITKALEKDRIKNIQNKLSEYIKGIVSNNNNKDILLYKYKISSKETEIISLVLEGLEYKEIAYQLKISLNTVKTHIKHIFNKCQINNKAELINIFN